ncbi:hypothetical protein BKA70DRAFT_1257103 [Coprinopsis sp. MPI-PUGE-AT-0042]|nr:hypothetical protein BKA70DRAFT_1257103 [Coprinopsis sp. MPI-PUGE-AT-0042]
MLSEDVAPPQNPSPRSKAGSPATKGHRRRTSALRLSSDTSATTSTLPEYSRTAVSSPTRFLRPTWEAEQIPEDSPPDYPGTQRGSDSAEEADEETELTGSDSDEDQGRRISQRGVPHYSDPASRTSSPHFRSRTPLTASPRRPKRFSQQQQQVLGTAEGLSHKRRHSSVSVQRLGSPRAASHKQTTSLSATPSKLRSPVAQPERDTDDILDSLLERSVHALEMSNTLLQSSMSTQATMSALFSGSSTSLGAFRSPTAPPRSQGYNSVEPIDGLPAESYHGYHDVDSALEARAIGLSSKLMRNWDVQENWAQELEKIKNGVDSLFNDSGDDEQGQRKRHRRRRSNSQQPHVRQASYSFPNTSPLSTLRQSNTALSSPNELRGRLSIDLFRNMDQPGDASSHQVADLQQEAGHHLGLGNPLPDQEEQCKASPATQAQLRLAPQGRSNLVSPAPRALTMYIDATPTPTLPPFQEIPHEESSLFVLPSTLGVRASASTTSLLLPSTTTSSAIAPPQVTETVHEPSTQAYNMLSSLAARTSASASTSSLLSPTSSSLKVPPRKVPTDAIPASAPSSFVSSFIHRAAAGMGRKRNSSPSVHSGPRRASSVDRPTSRSPTALRSPLPAATNSPSHPPPLIRRMTPPTEEENESSSSSSDGVVAKKTVESLRKLLDVQPPLSAVESTKSSSTLKTPPRMSRTTSAPNTRPASHSSRSSSLNRPSVTQRKPPVFMPRSPAPIPSAGTSHATASISKLFTKGVHTSSARPRSPPLRSNIKGKAPPRVRTDSTASGSSTPNTNQQLLVAHASLNGTNAAAATPNSAGISPSPSLSHFPEFVTRALASAGGGTSASSSGYSTPKRISFAELPESYASTKPEGEPSGMPPKRGKRTSLKRKSTSGSSTANGVESSGLNVRRPRSPDASSDGEQRSWWSTWLVPGRSTVLDSEATRDRMYHEDRVTRAWGGRMGMALGAGPGGMDEWGV